MKKAAKVALFLFLSHLSANKRLLFNKLFGAGEPGVAVSGILYKLK